MVHNLSWLVSFGLEFDPHSRTVILPQKRPPKILHNFPPWPTYGPFIVQNARPHFALQTSNWTKFCSVNRPRAVVSWTLEPGPLESPSPSLQSYPWFWKANSTRSKSYKSIFGTQNECSWDMNWNPLQVFLLKLCSVNRPRATVSGPWNPVR